MIYRRFPNIKLIFNKLEKKRGKLFFFPPFATCFFMQLRFVGKKSGQKV